MVGPPNMDNEWSQFMNRISQLPLDKQQKLHDQFSSVLDGHHTVVSLKEPNQKKRIGRPTLQAQRKLRVEERAEASTQRDPSAFEVVEQQLEAGKKRRRTSNGLPAKDCWCLHCNKVGHLVENCPVKAPWRST